MRISARPGEQSQGDAPPGSPAAGIDGSLNGRFVACYATMAWSVAVSLMWRQMPAASAPVVAAETRGELCAGGAGRPAKLAEALGERLAGSLGGGSQGPLIGPDRGAIEDVLGRFLHSYLSGDAGGLAYLVVPGTRIVAAAGQLELLVRVHGGVHGIRLVRCPFAALPREILRFAGSSRNTPT